MEAALLFFHPNTWMLLRDSAPVHDMLVVRKIFWRKISNEIGTSRAFHIFERVPLLAFAKLLDRVERLQNFRLTTCSDIRQPSRREFMKRVSSNVAKRENTDALNLSMGKQNLSKMEEVTP